MSTMVDRVTRDRPDELTKLGRDWVATMGSAQWCLGDAAVGIEPMHRFGGANPSGKDDLFSVSVGPRSSRPGLRRWVRRPPRRRGSSRGKITG